MTRTASPISHNSRHRKLLIKFIAASMPLIILLLLEGGLRLIPYGDNLKLFIPNPIEGYEEYMIVNPGAGKKYFQKLEYTAPPNDIFLREKPEETFRFFVMGSSTVVGFPYEENLMFSRILHKRLQDAFPGKHIEMVNTAITAINSFTLRDYTKEILKYKPDAVLIYAGHNEFYGAFGIGSNENMSKSPGLTRLHLWFMDFRFYQLFRNITSSTLGKIASGNSKQVHGTLMKRIVGDRDIPYDSDNYHLAMSRYRQNMGELILQFSEKQIPVFLSEVISNVKDIAPLSYQSTEKENEAMKAFRTAEANYEKGDYHSAKELYNKARDLDGVRFRASGEVNQIIEALSLKYDTHLVPMLQAFENNSPHGIIGSNLLTEHVHPNISGCFLMANTFFSKIVESGILGALDMSLIHSAHYYKSNWGYTTLDSLSAHHLIANLMTHWPFAPFDSEAADYRLSYRPASELDSIAFLSMADPNQGINDMRIDLAKDYAAHGKHQAAYWEHESLLRTNPYRAINYRDAASSLIILGDLPLALEYFQESAKYKASFYASYRMGEIYLIKGDYRRARKSLEEAFSLASDSKDKIKTLGKLFMACTYGNQTEDARSIANQLRKYDAAQFLNISPKKYTYLNYIPFQTKEQVMTAQLLISENKPQEALRLLESSLESYDSHIARRLMGEIYLQMENFQEAEFHMEKVYNEFEFDPRFLNDLILLQLSLENSSRANELFKQMLSIEENYKSIPMLRMMISGNDGTK